MTKYEATVKSSEEARLKAAELSGPNASREDEIREASHGIGFKNGSAYETARFLDLVGELDRTIQQTADSIKPKRFKRLMEELLSTLAADIRSDRNP